MIESLPVYSPSVLVVGVVMSHSSLFHTAVLDHGHFASLQCGCEAATVGSWQQTLKTKPKTEAGGLRVATQVAKADATVATAPHRQQSLSSLVVQRLALIEHVRSEEEVIV